MARKRPEVAETLEFAVGLQRFGLKLLWSSPEMVKVVIMVVVRR
jgi:hypothetical protein